MTIKARPTIYAGIQMRSRLEADFAAWLDRQELKWEYEPTCFAGPDGQWLPDFRLSGFGIYIEIKPYGFVKEGFDETSPNARIDRLLARMSQARLTEPDCSLAIILWEYEQVEWPGGFISVPRSDSEATWNRLTVNSLGVAMGLSMGLKRAAERESELRASAALAAERMVRSREGWACARGLMDLIEQSGDPALVERARGLEAEKRAEAERLLAGAGLQS